MIRPQNFQFYLMIVIGFIFISAAGCVQKNRSGYVSSNATTAYSEEKTMATGQGPRRYYRDENGRLYHVDSNGGLRVIERRVKVETGTGGLFSIIDDRNLRYYYDENNRLYYRDDAGNVLYIEESEPGKVIDPLPLLRGDYSGRRMRLRSPDYCTGEWNKCMNRCDASAGLGSRRSCLEECDSSREQCLQPY
jgi:hypothetical protein